MKMALRQALLGLLTHQDATGYELNATFKAQMIHFWHAHHTQIYRELLKMEEENLVRSVHVAQHDLPDKKIYSITDKGREELVRWLRQPTSFQPKMKDENLLRVSLLNMLPLEEAIAYLEETKVHHDYVANQIRMFQTQHQNEEDTIGYLLTSEYAVRMMENYSDWADWSIEMLKRHHQTQEKQES